MVLRPGYLWVVFLKLLLGAILLALVFGLLPLLDPYLAEDLTLLAALGLLVAYYFLEYRFAHRFISLHKADPADPPKSDDELFIQYDPGAYEPTEEEVSEARVAAGVAEHPVGVPWVCDTCNEENSAAFRLCWNCESEYENPDP